MRARRDERLRRQRQDECCNAHRCNLPFTLAAPRRRRAVEPVLSALCQSAAAQADLGGRGRGRTSVRVVTEESVATRETDGRGGLGLGDARARAAAARSRSCPGGSGRRPRGDGRQVCGRMQKCQNAWKGLGIPAAAAGASPEKRPGRVREPRRGRRRRWRRRGSARCSSAAALAGAERVSAPFAGRSIFVSG